MRRCLDELPPCSERCAALGEEVVAECTRTGGMPYRCAEFADAAATTCVEAACRGGAPDGEACELWAERLLVVCLRSGVDEEICDERSERAEEACDRAFCDDIEDEGDESAALCHARCDTRAEDVEERCAAAGRGDGCTGVAAAAAEECRTEGCVMPAASSDGEPSCEGGCRASADVVVRACLENGEGAVRCAARGDEASRGCRESHCDAGGDEEPSCEARCDAGVWRALRRCLVLGGREADCAARSRSRFDGCVALHCAAGNSCRTRCNGKADGARARCLTRGRDGVVCLAAAERVRHECEARRCPVLPPSGCADACEARVETIVDPLDPDGVCGDACDAVERGAREECATACAVEIRLSCAEGCETRALERLGSKRRRRALGLAQRGYRRCEERCEEDGEE
jgi:hypothetical protein